MNGDDVVYTATNQRFHSSCTNSINAGGKGYSPSLEHIKCDMRGLSPSPQKKKYDDFGSLRDEIAELWQETDKIELDEHNTLIVLMEKCWNEEAIYRGYEKEYLRKIGWCQSLLAQYIDIFPLSIIEKSKLL